MTIEGGRRSARMDEESTKLIQVNRILMNALREENGDRPQGIRLGVIFFYKINTFVIYFLITF